MTLPSSSSSHHRTTSATKLAAAAMGGKNPHQKWLAVVTLVAVVMLLLLRENSSPNDGGSSSTSTTAVSSSTRGAGVAGGVSSSPSWPTSTTSVSTTSKDNDDQEEEDGGGGGGDNNNNSKDEKSKPKKPIKPNNKIKQISILGERNSGTRWTYDHISECFNHTLKVEKHLTRYKHWFQYEDPTKYPHDTLVLAQFRNPYDWLKAMQHVPHHSPAHLRTSLKASTNSTNAMNDWEIFLTKPWTMERIGTDLTILEAAKLKGRNESNIMCQDDFPYRDIISCELEPLPASHYNYTIRYSEHQPFYELRNDKSGLPYPNILELRTDKIRNFLSVANYPGVADSWVVQYEYLLSKGTQHLLNRIEEWTGIQPNCKSKPPQPNRKQKKSRFITKQFAKHVRMNLNWTVEGYIGYEIDTRHEKDMLLQQ